MSSTESNLCTDCTQDLAHCHETLVVHTDGISECLDSHCAEAWETHLVVATCQDLDWSCECQKVGDSLPLAA
jgi:hypothetical protein